jgi:hypothetical protein
MSYRKMLFLIEESRLHNEVMWNIFELVLKGVKPSKEKWIEIRKVREIYPHLVSE